MSGNTAVDTKDVDPVKELEVVAGDTEKVTVHLYDGTPVEVLRCKVRHAAQVAKFFNTILISMGINSMSGAAALDLDNPQLMVNVVELAADDLIDVMVSLTSLSKEQILDLDIDDMLTLLTKALEINKAFFLKRVSAALSKLAPQEVTQRSPESP